MSAGPLGGACCDSKGRRGTSLQELRRRSGKFDDVSEDQHWSTAWNNKLRGAPGDLGPSRERCQLELYCIRSHRRAQAAWLLLSRSLAAVRIKEVSAQSNCRPLRQAPEQGAGGQWRREARVLGRDAGQPEAALAAGGVKGRGGVSMTQ